MEIHVLQGEREMAGDNMTMGRFESPEEPGFREVDFQSLLHWENDLGVCSKTGRIDGTNGRIAVEDNGSGFDVSNQDDGRYGLLGMQERATLIGGKLDIASAEGEGTTVTLEWTDRT